MHSRLTCLQLHVCVYSVSIRSKLSTCCCLRRHSKLLRSRASKTVIIPRYSRAIVCAVINKSRSLCWKVPGPCEPEDLIDGIIFAANYLGCTQVLSDKNPSKSVRMSQAQEAVSQIKVTCLS